MLILEASCLAIVTLYLVVRIAVDPVRPRLVRRLGLLMAASWVAENSVIHAYAFYQYSPAWSIFVDRVPLMIVVIWPIVIISAWDLVRALAGGRGGLAVVLLTAAMVFADAYVMEPIAVSSRLWSWNAPGLFEVPPIGVLGWSLFTGSCLAIFDRVDRKEARGLWDLLVLVLPIGFVHLALVALWWGLFRWISVPIPGEVGVLVAWLACATLALVALRHPAARRVSRRDLLLRVPAAAFFFVLLGLHSRNKPLLVAYAVAFALPYLVLTARARSGGAR